MAEIRACSFAPLHIQGRCDSKYARTSSTKGPCISLKPTLDSNPSSPSSKRPHLAPAETSLISITHDPHPLESSLTSCLSSLNEFEFDSSPYFRMEIYFP